MCLVRVLLTSIPYRITYSYPRGKRIHSLWNEPRGPSFVQYEYPRMKKGISLPDASGRSVIVGGECVVCLVCFSLPLSLSDWWLVYAMMPECLSARSGPMPTGAEHNAMHRPVPHSRRTRRGRA